jgi:YegS/Rv2252/BmrU family lipid kinase
MAIRVIFNPTARSGKSRNLLRWLEQTEIECELKPTSCAGEGRALAAAAVRDGCATVVAAGGDGTINEVVNGIADVPGGLDQTRLGLLPVGSVNVFSRELGVPSRLEDAWRVVLSGRETRLDLPVVEYRHAEGTVCQHFVQLAGAGLDARAVEMVSQRWKRCLGPSAYLIAACRAWVGPHPLIRVDATNRSCCGRFVLIGNGRCYGGRWPAFPDADFQDGRLEIRVFRNLGWLMIARTLRALASGRIRQLRDADHLQSAEFALRVCAEINSDFAGGSWAGGRGGTEPSASLRGQSSINGDTLLPLGLAAGPAALPPKPEVIFAQTLSAAEEVPLELDGEAVGRLPARFKVRPRALRVLVPCIPA